jgi:hypothetical protein
MKFFSKTYYIQKEISVDDSMGAVPLTLSGCMSKRMTVGICCALEIA